MYSLPTSTTFAVLTIASAASTAPMRPLVSIIPRASNGMRAELQSSAWRYAVCATGPRTRHGAGEVPLGRWRRTGAYRSHRCATALGQHLEETPPDPVGVPGRVRDEMLKGLVGDRLRDAGQHRLHRLAIAVAEHAVHVRPQREPLRAMAEAALKRFE